MSAASTLVTAEHFRYIASHTPTEDDFLKELRADARRAALPDIHIAPEQGGFMRILLTLMGAKEVVEVGTLGGYSAIWMARSGARVTTIEISEKHADFAERWIRKSEVAERVKVLRGAGKDVLPLLADGSKDAAFLDADKAGYPDYLRECLRIVRPGGLIMVDNAFAFGELFVDPPRDPEVKAVRAFNEIMAKTPKLRGIIVPLGDGLWVAVRE
ncbi:MAG TPA: O-methyltransferase [Planctomycetota bacterium]|nr:O-methyltransferase [Planctomycetota bacterium]